MSRALDRHIRDTDSQKADDARHRRDHLETRARAVIEMMEKNDVIRELLESRPDKVALGELLIESRNNEQLETFLKHWEE